MQYASSNASVLNPIISDNKELVSCQICLQMKILPVIESTSSDQDRMRAEVGIIQDCQRFRQVMFYRQLVGTECTKKRDRYGLLGLMTDLGWDQRDTCKRHYEMQGSSILE